jgi:hypothetical protein
VTKFSYRIAVSLSDSASRSGIFLVSVEELCGSGLSSCQGRREENKLENMYRESGRSKERIIGINFVDKASFECSKFFKLF